MPARGNPKKLNDTGLKADPVSVPDLPTGGTIGDALIIDAAGQVVINQTTPAQTVSLPPLPGVPFAVKSVSNRGTTPVVAHGQTIAVGGSSLFTWDGTSWSPSVDATRDGNNWHVPRSDSVVDVEPTAAEVPSPTPNTTATLYLQDGTTEQWTYNGAAWSKVIALARSQTSESVLLAALPANVWTACPDKKVGAPPITDIAIFLGSERLSNRVQSRVSASGKHAELFSNRALTNLSVTYFY